MKSYTEFINEKFDYTKQSHYKSFSDLKQGDGYYTAPYYGVTVVRDDYVYKIKVKKNILKITKGTGAQVEIDLNFCYKNMGVQIFEKATYMIASTDKDLLYQFRNSIYGEKYEQYCVSKTATKENLFELIKKFLENKII